MIPDHVSEGRIVNLGDLGKFHLRGHSEGSDSAETVSAINIKSIKMGFRPERYASDKLNKAPSRKRSDEIWDIGELGYLDFPDSPFFAHPTICTFLKMFWRNGKLGNIKRRDEERENRDKTKRRMRERQFCKSFLRFTPSPIR